MRLHILIGIFLSVCVLALVSVAGGAGAQTINPGGGGHDMLVG